MFKRLIIMLACLNLMCLASSFSVNANDMNGLEEGADSKGGKLTDTDAPNNIEVDERSNSGLEDSTEESTHQENELNTENEPIEKEEQDIVDSKPTLNQDDKENPEINEEHIEEEDSNEQQEEGHNLKTNENSVPQQQKIESIENVIVKGNTRYYFNKLNEITFAEVYSGSELIEIQEFHPHTSVENAEENIKYIFKVDSSGNILTAAKLDQHTKKVTNHYEYYPNTVYGAHGNHIQYIFDLDMSGFLKKAAKRAQGSKQVVTMYEYYPGTIYGQHTDQISYIFDITANGYLLQAAKRAQGSKRIVTRYEYYPKTVYGRHTNRISYIFDITANGYLSQAAKRAQSSTRIVTRYEYYPKTTYGRHTDRIMYLFDINSKGFITKAAKRQQGSKQILSRYEYYPNTKFGAHQNNIQYTFNQSAAGYITTAAKTARGSNQILSRYEYYPQTVYGKHGRQIKYLFNIDSSGYIKEAFRRKKGSSQTISRYTYQPKTTYGKHGSKIIGIKLNVPLINQLPELPTGCEITSVTMMLNYKGLNLNKVNLAMEMPKHSWNPSLGYVGDPFTRSGWTIYPTALYGLIKKYAGSAVNLTGKSTTEIENHISGLKTVVTWVSPMHGFTVHAIVLTGYDKDNYYFNDPWTGEKEVKMSKGKFITIWNNQSNRAISY